MHLTKCGFLTLSIFLCFDLTLSDHESINRDTCRLCSCEPDGSLSVCLSPIKNDFDAKISNRQWKSLVETSKKLNLTLLVVAIEKGTLSMRQKSDGLDKIESRLDTYRNQAFQCDYRLITDFNRCCHQKWTTSEKLRNFRYFETRNTNFSTCGLVSLQDETLYNSESYHLLNRTLHSLTWRWQKKKIANRRQSLINAEIDTSSQATTLTLINESIDQIKSMNVTEISELEKSSIPNPLVIVILVCSCLLVSIFCGVLFVLCRSKVSRNFPLKIDNLCQNVDESISMETFPVRYTQAYLFEVHANSNPMDKKRYRRATADDSVEAHTIEYVPVYRRSFSVPLEYSSRQDSVFESKSRSAEDSIETITVGENILETIVEESDAKTRVRKKTVSFA